MPAQSDWVRVKDETTGHERSTLVVSEGEKIIDRPAADRYGQPYPPKHNRPLASLTDVDGKTVAKMSVDELTSYAAANGVVVDGDKPKKDDLVAAIVAHESSDPETPPAGEGSQA